MKFYKGISPTVDQLCQKRMTEKLTQKRSADLLFVGLTTWQDWEYGLTPMPVGMWELYHFKTQQIRANLTQKLREQEEAEDKK